MSNNGYLVSSSFYSESFVQVAVCCLCRTPLLVYGAHLREKNECQKPNIIWNITQKSNWRVQTAHRHYYTQKCRPAWNWERAESFSSNILQLNLSFIVKTLYKSEQEIREHISKSLSPMAFFSQVYEIFGDLVKEEFIEEVYHRLLNQPTVLNRVYHYRPAAWPNG